MRYIASSNLYITLTFLVKFKGSGILFRHFCDKNLLFLFINLARTKLYLGLHNMLNVFIYNLRSSVLLGTTFTIN